MGHVPRGQCSRARDRDGHGAVGLARAVRSGSWPTIEELLYRAAGTVEDVAGRMRRVNESLRQVLSEAVLELKDPRIGFVTVTGVETTPDLRQATVFVSILGGQKKRDASMRGLENAHGALQAQLARQIRMKRTPTLTFEYDPSVERGVRMTQLIDELAPDDDRPE